MPEVCELLLAVVDDGEEEERVVRDLQRWMQKSKQNDVRFQKAKIIT